MFCNVRCIFLHLRIKCLLVFACVFACSVGFYLLVCLFLFLFDFFLLVCIFAFLLTKRGHTRQQHHICWYIGTYIPALVNPYWGWYECIFCFCVYDGVCTFFLVLVLVCAPFLGALVCVLFRLKKIVLTLVRTCWSWLVCTCWC